MHLKILRCSLFGQTESFKFSSRNWNDHRLDTLGNYVLGAGWFFPMYGLFLLNFLYWDIANPSAYSDVHPWGSQTDYCGGEKEK